jgi:hypothetical protein
MLFNIGEFGVCLLWDKAGSTTSTSLVESDDIDIVSDGESPGASSRCGWSLAWSLRAILNGVKPISYSESSHVDTP